MSWSSLPLDAKRHIFEAMAEHDEASVLAELDDDRSAQLTRAKRLAGAVSREWRYTRSPLFAHVLLSTATIPAFMRAAEVASVAVLVQHITMLARPPALGWRGNCSYHHLTEAFQSGRPAWALPRLRTLCFDVGPDNVDFMLLSASGVVVSALVVLRRGWRFVPPSTTRGALPDKPPPPALPSLKTVGFTALDFARPEPRRISPWAAGRAANTLLPHAVLVDRFGRPYER